MKINILTLTFIFGMVITFITSCNKEETQEEIENTYTIPKVSTSPITDITSISANSGGNVTSDGGSPVTAKGICWNTAPNPTKEHNTTSDGTGTGSYSSNIDGLTSNTTYYLRAYATNAVGTAYGNEISFTTINEDTQVTAQFEIFKIIDGKEIRNIIKTSDGGYIGIAFSEDYNVIKFDENFNIIWNKTYGGSNKDYAQSISQTLDGGYLVLGYTYSSDGDITVNHGEIDIWACKIDETGNLVWERSYGGSAADALFKEKSLLLTDDGGFMFIGYSRSNDGDVSSNKGESDVWLVKANATGEIEFEKTFGGSENDYGRQIIKTNSNFTLSIQTISSDGDFNARGNWIIQIDQSGNEIWKTNFNVLNSGAINTTSDNGIVVVNSSETQFLLHKLDFNGNVIMSNILDFQAISSKQPSSEKIQETSDQGFIIIGDLGNGSHSDALLFRVNKSLNKLYHKIYAGNNFDSANSFIPLSADNYIFQFFTASGDIPGIPNSSGEASVIVKLEEIID